MELGEVADELYGLPLAEFIEARTAHSKRAKADGEKELAAQIAKLPKPSTAAWAVNTLGRRAPDELDRVLDLGEALREAQEALDGAELRELTRQRQALISELVGRTRAETRAAGHPISDAVAEEVEQTLRAAMADEEAAVAVRSRQLTAGISASGGGSLAAAATGTGAATARTRRSTGGAEKGRRADKKSAGGKAVAKAGTKAGSKADISADDSAAAKKAAAEKTAAEAAAAEAERLRQVEEAQQAVEDANARADAAEDEVSNRQHRVDDAADRREDIQVAIRELEASLKERAAELAAVDAELESVREDLEAAQKASREAREAADEAADLLAERRSRS